VLHLVLVRGNLAELGHVRELHPFDVAAAFLALATSALEATSVAMDTLPAISLASAGGLLASSSGL
jgi:hypothetical protein